MQSKENINPYRLDTQEIRLRDSTQKLQPLKDVNYRHQSQLVHSGKMQKSDQPLASSRVAPTLLAPGDKKPKQKISLTEYRERAKSKSPNKPEDAHDSSDLNAVNDGLANMSIDESSVLDETTGLFVKENCASHEKAAKSDRLKLKKSSSSSSCGESHRSSETRASKSYSSLPKVAEVNEDASLTDKHIKVEPQSTVDKADKTTERQKVEQIRFGQMVPEPKSAQQTAVQRSSSLQASPEIIDLTEDEESPNVMSKNKTDISSSASYQMSEVRKEQNKQPIASFHDLIQPMKQQDTKSKNEISHSKQWTQMRDPSSKESSSNRQGGGELDTERLKQSLQLHIERRNELAKALEKQKSLVAKVKMSELPDKGEKLRTNIDRLTSDLQQVNISINTKLSKLNAAVKTTATDASTEAYNKAADVVRVYPDRSQVVQKGAQNVDVQLAGGPRIVRVHPDGSQTTLSAGSQLPSGVRIVKVNPGSAGTQSGQYQAHNPDNLKQTSLLPHVAQIPPHILQQMYAANPQAMQLYGGRMTAARLREVGSVTKEAIEGLHKQLETMPTPQTELDDPEGLNISLMPHQRQALAWLTWRERQSPSGGILADDMGLGKTLTMISLILKQRELRTRGAEDDKSVWLNRDKQLEKMGKSVVKSNATLVVCPASLIHQWRTEIERRCDPGLLRVCLYHGQNREKNVLKLAGHDVVLTTYNIVSKEVVLDDSDKNAETPVKDDTNSEEKESNKDGGSESNDQAPKPQTNIMRIAWERIILDEGHNIKNHKSQQSRAVSRLRAGFRWALTGTPIQNDLLDMYSLLRFLRCAPFDEYKVWKRQVDTGSRTGQDRLNVLVKTLLLRRTKKQTSESGKPLVALPDKSVTTHELSLSAQEKQVYDMVFDRSRSALKEYLKRHEDKDVKGGSRQPSSNPFSNKLSDTGSFIGSSGGGSTNQAGLSMGASNVGPMKAQHILVLLLRLRQCCCHLSLMKDAVDDETQENEGVELSLEDQLMDLALSDTDREPDNSEAGAQSKTQQEPTLTKSSPVFQTDYMSTKMQALMDELMKIHRPSDSKEKCKSVIVSQWTKMLEIVAVHLAKRNLKCSVIRGDIPAKKRMEAVDLFNNDPSGPEVMLVSLRAGGCGLNLIGGNHLFLLDSHWNPALEDQACDRIYRVGQEKNVFIHRFLCKETVEEKIIDLQKKKQSLADNVLTGSATAKSKLSLADLRMLFNV